MIKIEQHNGVNVLRDDLLPGGTKSVLMDSIIGNSKEYVYASPVYGGFQIALSIYCKSVNKKATIFCAGRKVKHQNTIRCIKNGAKIIECSTGYLTVVEKRARDYCQISGAKKITFGAKTESSKQILSNRVKEVIKTLGKEPDEIWCAIGSGLLVESILQGTTTAIINGVQVGAEYKNTNPRIKVHKYPQPFDKESKFKSSFPSMPNYDLKAWEFCNKFKQSDDVLFWNVL